MNAHCYELIGDLHLNKNTCTFNPYSNHHNTNLIGDQIDREEENNTIWAEISESLVNCSYKQPKHIQPSNSDELNIFSLNIRSLIKCITPIRENIANYEKYDVLCFNETNCTIDKLANGIDDLILEGFHPPIIQKPARSSGKGGGLATYVSKRICQPEDLEVIDLDTGLSDLDGEFLFIKIKDCKSYNNTVIVGNVYRSPSKKHNKFVELLEIALGKLDRHSRKQILIVGDFNTDLIKYESDVHCQSLIDTTSNRGFVQVISRPTRITDHSASLIDHIYTNKIENLVTSSVLTIDLSDHLATYVQVKISFDTNNHPSRPQNLNPGRTTQDEEAPSGDWRIFNAANDEKFKELIDIETWDIPENLDAEEQYNHLLRIYNG
ncbi:MAG: endonuclease/exonuclease/phosphatase family protein, partial [Cytophagales bacterium]|nr:endonuclease/exonuclease/phosphatase family protein [Cytophagales bacterium]